MPDPCLSHVAALGRGLSLGSVRLEELDNCEYPVSSNLSIGGVSRERDMDIMSGYHVDLYRDLELAS